MTVESTQTKEIYEGNGSSVIFPVPFTYSRTDDIKLVFTDAHGIESDIASNYAITVTESGDTSVTYPVSGMPIAMGTRLTVYRATPQKQIVDLIYGGAFNPDVLELDVFDRVVMMIQELQEAVNRSVKTPFTSDVVPDELLDAIYASVKAAEDAAAAAQEALAECQELIAIIPIPTVSDAGKVLAVRLFNGVPTYTLVSGGGGGGAGFAEYSLDVTNSNGKVVVSLAALGHPEMPGLFNPIVNIISVVPYFCCITNRSAEEFTVQIYKPGGQPGMEISEYIECGTFAAGEGIECGQGGSESNVKLAVSIPIPPAD